MSFLRNKKIMFLTFIIFMTLLSFIIYRKDKVTYYSDSGENTEVELKVTFGSLYGMSKRDLFIYNLSGDKIGKIGKNVELELESDKIVNKHYIKLANFDDSYVRYEGVDPITELSLVDNRYKNYIVFNKNIVTNEVTNFYDINDNLVYAFNKSFDLPIIITDSDRYGIEFNNRLLYVKKDNVKDIIDKQNTDQINSTGISVLNYHFIYEDGDTACNEMLCIPASQIEKHFTYLKENNFFTLKLYELEMYIDGKIRLPKKSVVLTFDDGAQADVAKKYIDKYQVNAALFLITSWFSKDQFESDYFEIHSHGDNLHNGGMCPGGQGGEIKCMEKEKLLADLNASRKKLDNTTYFCYPFYEYNQYSIDTLKEAGFTMAFGGPYEGGKSKASVGIDKFRIPRFVIVDSTTMEQFISYVNGWV